MARERDDKFIDEAEAWKWKISPRTEKEKIEQPPDDDVDDKLLDEIWDKKSNEGPRSK